MAKFFKNLAIVCLTIAVVIGVVYYESLQIMLFIEEQPNCFPPYVLMSELAGHVSKETYLQRLFAVEGGVRFHAGIPPGETCNLVRY